MLKMIKVLYKIVDGNNGLIHMSALPHIGDTIIIEDEMFNVMGVLWDTSIMGVYEPVIGLSHLNTEK